MHNFNERVLTKNCFLVFIMTAGLFLSACGGGGGNNNDNVVVKPQSSNTPTLSFQQTKQFVFTWDDVNDATFYRILENPDGNSGFAPVSDDIAQGNETFLLEVALHKRTNARYSLESCNSAGCTNSSEISVSGNLVGGIGYLKADNTNEDDNFGNSVSLSADGTTLAVSAPQEDSIGPLTLGAGGDTLRESGAVYVFIKTNDEEGWRQQAFIKASNAGLRNLFGSSVSLSSDGATLAVGAINQGFGGGAYIFTRNNDMEWSEQSFLKPSNIEERDFFGRTVSISGDGTTLAVGANGEDSKAKGINQEQDNNDASGSGAVYVFARDDDMQWPLQAYIKASNPDVNDGFGGTVSLNYDGTTLAVGANGEDSNAKGINQEQDNNEVLGSGAVYVFARNNANMWSQQAYLKASNTDEGDGFGFSISLSSDGKNLAVSANREDSDARGVYSDDNNVALESGAVYIFTRDNANNWSQQAYIKASNTDEGDEFGFSVSLSADGKSLAVGAFSEGSNAVGLNGDQTDNSAGEVGAVYVFKNNEGIWSQQAYVKPSTFIADEETAFGIAISLSGDGSTLAIGADFERSNATGVNGNQLDSSAFASGAVYLY